MTNKQDRHRFQPTVSYAKEFNTVRDLNKESAKFLWFQLLTVMVENITDDEIAIVDLLTYAREQYIGNKAVLDEITKFGDELNSSKKQFDALRWYTSNTFVSQLVNSALKQEDYLVLHRFRAFIKRLINAIKDESQTTKEFWQETCPLYSGRSLTDEDISVLKSQKDEVIAINGFLSTSFSAKAARAYHNNTYFRIATPVDLQTIYFASIRHHSDIKDDDEVLFSLSSTFRVGETTYGRLDEDVEGWIVDLTPTDDGSDIFKTYLSWRQYCNSSHAIIFGHLLIQMGEYEAALTYFDEYCQTEDELELLIQKGCVYLRREGKGDLELAEKFFRRASTILNNKLDLDASRSSVLTNLGILYDRLGRYDDALKNFTESKEFVRDDPLMTAIINNNIGVVYDQGLENYAEAVVFYELALEYYRQFPTHHAYAQTILNLACALDSSGQHGRARSLYYEAKSVFDRTLPPTHDDIRRLLLNIALTYHCEGQFDKSIDINLQAKDPSKLDSLVEASRLCNIGETFREKGLFLLAMKYSRQGLNMRRRILRPTSNHVDIATALFNIGQIYLAQGLLADAHCTVEEAKTLLMCSLSPDRVEHSPILATVYDCIARLLLERGDINQALEYGQKARAIFEHEKMTSVIDYATCLLTIANGNIHLKRYNLAHQIATQILSVFKNDLARHPAKTQVFYCLACIAEILNDLVTARRNIQDAIQHLEVSSSTNVRLFYKCTNKCAVICFRLKDYTNAYKYLNLPAVRYTEQ